LENVENLDI